MENQVTKIILEKQKLELQLKALSKKAERKIEEEVKDSLINNLNKALEIDLGLPSKEDK